LLPLKSCAAAAASALQTWYGADSYSSSTGLYTWNDPNFNSDAGGSAIATIITLGGYRSAFQDTLRWWNSANAITALIDYMLVTGDRSYLGVVEATFARGPSAFTINVGTVAVSAAAAAAAGAATGAVIGNAVGGAVGAVIGGIIGGIAGFFGGGSASAATIARIYFTNFINATSNGFYDDEGWWALAWLKAYDLTADQNYLDMALTIFNDMTGGWDYTCNGGIYWKKDHTDGAGHSPYKNAIANELFLAVAAGIHRRVAAAGGQSSTGVVTLNWANWEWEWFRDVGLINSANLINDSLTTSASPEGPCKNDGTEAVWSYNQGVILGGLCDMYEITQDTSYLAVAEKIADAFIQNPVSASGTPAESGVDGNGILTEFSDLSSSPSIDNCQFKGIFVRNLGYLCATTGNAKYSTFLMKNAASAIHWMNPSNQFGNRWDEGVSIADFVRQTAGLDLLNAALMVQNIAADSSFLEPLLLDDRRRDPGYLQPLLLDDRRKSLAYLQLLLLDNLEARPDVAYLEPLLLSDQSTGRRDAAYLNLLLLDEPSAPEDLAYLDPLLLDDD
jgi:predicted alpha-1,6-mannanase (GH76 family)